MHLGFFPPSDTIDSESVLAVKHSDSAVVFGYQLD